MNESINRIVDEFDDKETLKAALLARDEEVLDSLRMAAARHGLAPAMIAVALLPIGLGEPPTDEQIEYLMGAARAEQEAMHQQFHQATGTECTCPRPEHPGQ